MRPKRAPSEKRPPHSIPAILRPENLHGKFSKSGPPTGRATPENSPRNLNGELKQKGRTSNNSESRPSIPAVPPKPSEKKDGKQEDLVLLCPEKYKADRSEEEIEVIGKTLELVKKRDPTLLKRYRSDYHKISRIVMREVRPKNGFNFVKAARFFHETVEWREKFFCEHALRYPPGKLNILNMFIPEMFYNCFDHEGIPVLFLRFGLGSGKQILSRLTAQEWAMCHAYQLDMMELMCRQQTKKLGKWIDKIRVVIDFEGVSIFAVRDFISYAKRCAHMDTTYYTGLMLSTHLVNVPSSLSWATTLFWPFVSAGVKRKVFLFTTGFESTLQKFIPVDALPKKYGGNRSWEQADPNTIDWKKHDEDVRKVCYKTMEIKRVRLKSGEEHTVKIECEPGTQVEYFFETDVSGLQFEVEENQKDRTETLKLVEKGGRKSHLVPEKSHVSIYTKSSVLFRWENSYGWSSRKQVLSFGFKIRKLKIPESDGSLGHLRLME